jgi:diguanylate cyclase (GGDEF)-like protein
MAWLLTAIPAREGLERPPHGKCAPLQDHIGNPMIRVLALAFAIAASWGTIALAAEPGTITTLHDIHTLSKAEAGKGLSVAFEATVTYYNKSDVDLFVQEGGEAIYVETKPNEGLMVGDRVLVRGKTRDSFTPDVLSDNVSLLHHGDPPKPLATEFERLIHAELDCMLVTVHATVRSADRVNFGNVHGIYLRLLMDQGYIDAMAVDTDTSTLNGLLDAEVDVTGVVSGKFDSKMQLTGILLEVSRLSDVRILKRAQTSPSDLKITPMHEVLSSYSVHDLTHRVRVKGTITYYQPGSAVVLQDGANSLWVWTHASNPMRIGDIAEATGFPDARSSFLALTDGEIEDRNIFEPVQPHPSTWRQLATWNSGDPDGHQNDLVSFEGQVVAAVREGSQDEFVLVSGGKLFTAIYRHPPGNGPLPPMEEIPLGTRIRVAGICTVAQANTIDPSEQEVPFNILLRSFDDIDVIASASLLSTRNLIVVVGVLLLVVIAVGARGWAVERRMRRNTDALGNIEQRRSRILEDINGSRPLTEIIEQITEMASLKLRGAPCWCQIADGARLGNCPSNLATCKIVHEEINARSGPPLGKIFVALDPLIKPGVNESQALSIAAGLATLAIENRLLYSDLRRRSEFDLLTDIHNRFSLEKHLDTLIDDARKRAGIFGLLYIDLDKFKQVNDVYGHHVGDLYLQEAAQRMKLELRGADKLARLGGDEFAAVVAVVHTRADVEVIAERMVHAFDEPFVIEGYVLKGSASFGIAIYPEDGTTKDNLFTTADAAMYVNKHTRRESTEVAAGFES